MCKRQTSRWWMMPECQLYGKKLLQNLINPFWRWHIYMILVLGMFLEWFMLCVYLAYIKFCNGNFCIISFYYNWDGIIIYNAFLWWHKRHSKKILFGFKNVFMNNQSINQSKSSIIFFTKLTEWLKIHYYRTWCWRWWKIHYFFNIWNMYIDNKNV